MSSAGSVFGKNAMTRVMCSIVFILRFVALLRTRLVDSAYYKKDERIKADVLIECMSLFVDVGFGNLLMRNWTADDCHS